MATIPGVIHGKTIELERESGLPEGQQVAVCATSLALKRACLR